MEIKYNLTVLSSIINDLAQLSGITMAILDNNYNYVASTSSANDYCTFLQSLGSNQHLCSCSDNEVLINCAKTRHLEVHVCHAGLCDAAMPIVKNDMILGYVLFGRVRSSDSPKETKYLTNNKNDNNMLSRLYHRIPYLTRHQLDCLYDLLSHILFERAIEIESGEFMEKAIAYIDTHITQKINIDMLCHQLNVSKNYLYHSFRSYCDKTVNEYITSKRVNLAKELLTTTASPIYQIAEDVGIDNYTYFCKLFKKIVGKSAKEYRIEHKQTF